MKVEEEQERILHRNCEAQQATMLTPSLAVKKSPSSALSAFCWKLTNASNSFCIFRPPLGPRLENLTPTFESKQVLAFNKTSIGQATNIIAQYRSQGLHHAVPQALPPVLQSQGSNLMSLQQGNWSTLQCHRRILLISYSIKK